MHLNLFLIHARYQLAISNQVWSLIYVIKQPNFINICLTYNLMTPASAETCVNNFPITLNCPASEKCNNLATTKNLLAEYQGSILLAKSIYK